MQVMTVVESIPANSLSANLIAGQANEFLSGPSIVALYARAAAVGLNLIFQIGNEVYSQDQEVGSLAGFPQRPDDFFVRGEGGQGERIIVQARNTTAGAIIVQLILDVNRVG